MANKSQNDKLFIEKYQRKPSIRIKIKCSYLQQFAIFRQNINNISIGLPENRHNPPRAPSDRTYQIKPTIENLKFWPCPA